MEKHSMVNMALLHRIFVIHLLCARANSRHHKTDDWSAPHGFATLGTIRFEGRFDYAAIGTVSNVASRLCDEEPARSASCREGRNGRACRRVALKGIRCPMAAYNVLAPSTTKPHWCPLLAL